MEYIRRILFLSMTVIRKGGRGVSVDPDLLCAVEGNESGDDGETMYLYKLLCLYVVVIARYVF